MALLLFCQRQTFNKTAASEAFNVIEYQGSDNTITLSNGSDITVVNPGVYEVTADVSIAPDYDTPNDSGMREAFIFCSDYPSEKFGQDRRASPGDGTDKDYTRYTTSCYIKTLSSNSILNLKLYQNNDDGDTIAIFSHAPAIYTRLVVRRVA